MVRRRHLHRLALLQRHTPAARHPLPRFDLGRVREPGGVPPGARVLGGLAPQAELWAPGRLHSHHGGAGEPGEERGVSGRAGAPLPVPGAQSVAGRHRGRPRGGGLRAPARVRGRGNLVHPRIPLTGGVGRGVRVGGRGGVGLHLRDLRVHRARGHAVRHALSRPEGPGLPGHGRPRKGRVFVRRAGHDERGALPRADAAGAARALPPKAGPRLDQGLHRRQLRAQDRPGLPALGRAEAPRHREVRLRPRPGGGRGGGGRRGGVGPRARAAGLHAVRPHAARPPHGLLHRPQLVPAARPAPGVLGCQAAREGAADRGRDLGPVDAPHQPHPKPRPRGHAGHQVRARSRG
mmetsp:Transcript_4206/g.10025  ORF Transcript_4206/g.10025 Transcript_4206/m.10025 type:complete len:349 (+) Transcript_4206:679-1725(+)